MDKKTNKKWMEIAENVLQATGVLFKDGERKTTIYKGYDGQASAFGVSILMMGLKPTIAVYYQDQPPVNPSKAYRYCLLKVIFEMLKVGEKLAGNTAFEGFVRSVIAPGGDDEALKTDILNCSIALKQVIRTYKLEE